MLPCVSLANSGQLARRGILRVKDKGICHSLQTINLLAYNHLFFHGYQKEYIIFSYWTSLSPNSKSQSSPNLSLKPDWSRQGQAQEFQIWTLIYGLWTSSMD